MHVATNLTDLNLLLNIKALSENVAGKKMPIIEEQLFLRASDLSTN